MSKFKTIDEEYETFFRGDIEALLSLPKKTIEKIIQISEDGVAFAKVLEDRMWTEFIERIAEECKIDDDIANRATSALRNLATYSSRKEYVAELSSDLKLVGFKTRDINRITPIVAHFEKAGVAEKIETARDKVLLSKTVLPYLVSVEIAYDYRYHLEKGKVKYKIPLLIARLQLRSGGIDDRKDDFVNLQIDVGTTRKLIKALDERLKELQTIK